MDPSDRTRGVYNRGTVKGFGCHRRTSMLRTRGAYVFTIACEHMVTKVQSDIMCSDPGFLQRLGEHCFSRLHTEAFYLGLLYLHLSIGAFPWWPHTSSKLVNGMVGSKLLLLYVLFHIGSLLPKPVPGFERYPSFCAYTLIS